MHVRHEAVSGALYMLRFVERDHCVCGSILRLIGEGGSEEDGIARKKIVPSHFRCPSSRPQAIHRPRGSALLTQNNRLWAI